MSSFDPRSTTLAVLLLLGCAPSAPVTEAPPVPSSAHVRREDFHDGSWLVDYVDPPVDDGSNCPDGHFCVVGRAWSGAEGTAPAPFLNCAAKMPMVLPGYDAYQVKTRFSPAWTRHEREHERPRACCYDWVEKC
ncbi:MAG: hypothetical protein U0271_12215 [Polyangiaceae bacterium]